MIRVSLEIPLNEIISAEVLRLPIALEVMSRFIERCVFAEESVWAMPALRRPFFVPLLQFHISSPNAHSYDLKAVSRRGNVLPVYRAWVWIFALRWTDANASSRLGR